jgi:hypothetical protein
MHLVGFIIKKFVTKRHGHTNVKYLNTVYRFLLLNSMLFRLRSYLVGAVVTLFIYRLLVLRGDQNSYYSLLVWHRVIWSVDSKDSEENSSPLKGKSERR